MVHSFSSECFVQVCLIEQLSGEEHWIFSLMLLTAELSKPCPDLSCPFFRPPYSNEGYVGL